MDTLQNLVEYYEELYPVTEDRKKFYDEIIRECHAPAHVLGIGCRTGLFEYALARQGLDVTGIDAPKEFIESANRKRRTQLMALRFFQMASTEMSRFLSKNFYNIISCLDDKLMYMNDEVRMAKFFADCKSMLAEGGKFIIELPNFEFYNGNSEFTFPVRQSIRAKLFTDVFVNSKDEAFLTQTIEAGNSRVLPVFTRRRIYPILSSEIRRYANKAGFSSIDIYGGFDKSPVTMETEGLVVVMS